MKIGDICIRDVVYVEEQESLLAVAELMRKHHVGSVLVVKKVGDRLLPVGILTDRDLVVEVIAPNVDPEKLLVQDVMSFNLVTAKEENEMWEVASLMQSKGIRRVPVVDNNGYLTGVFCMDDILEIVTAELSGLVKLVDREHRNEVVARA
jgi:CBS domain-containing protein